MSVALEIAAGAALVVAVAVVLVFLLSRHDS
jgi:hypothetical protein